MARTWTSRQEAEAEFSTYRDTAHIPLIRFDAMRGVWTTVSQEWLDAALGRWARERAEREFPNG